MYGFHVLVRCISYHLSILRNITENACTYKVILQLSNLIAI